MVQKLTSYSVIAAGVLLLLPVFAFAQTFGGEGQLSSYLNTFVTFINSVIIPLIIALAILVFIWGIFLYFIVGADDETKRDQGKKLMLWGLIGFIVIFAIVGIINLLVDATGLGGADLEADLPELPGIGSDGG